jgi:hypothetical protein
MPTDADELNASTGEEAADAGTQGTEGAAGETGAAVASSAAGKAAGAADAGKGGDAGKGEQGKATGDKAAGDKAAGDKATGKTVKATVASGGDADEQAAAKAAEESDAAKAAARAEEIKAFRETLAKHASAGDKKAFDKELKRLERLGIERPEQVYGLYRELDNKLNGGGLVKVPGKDATPEEVAAFNKAIGVPEKPEDLVAAIQLDNGAVVGDADKPVLEVFASAMHKAGATPKVMSAAVSAYYAHLAKVEADQADADDQTVRETTAKLKEELGPAFRREMGALKSLFDAAPGGGDDKNPESLYARVMTARTPDGKLLGNDIDFLNLMRTWRQDIRPFATVTEDGAGGAKSAEARLAEIQALRQTDKKRYWSPDIQAEELRLIEMLERNKARATA